jgi:hypothetical protein
MSENAPHSLKMFELTYSRTPMVRINWDHESFEYAERGNADMTKISQSLISQSLISQSLTSQSLTSQSLISQSLISQSLTSQSLTSQSLILQSLISQSLTSSNDRCLQSVVSGAYIANQILKWQRILSKFLPETTFSLEILLGFHCGIWWHLFTSRSKARFISVN